MSWFKKDNKIIGCPGNRQRLADFEINLRWLNDIIPLKRLPNEYQCPTFIKYELVDQWRELCYETVQELVDNPKPEIAKYKIVSELIDQTIEVFETNNDLMNADMSIMSKWDYEPFILHNRDNWYKLIYDELLIVKRQFDRNKNLNTLIDKEFNKDLFRESNDQKLFDFLIPKIALNENGEPIHTGLSAIYIHMKDEKMIPGGEKLFREHFENIYGFKASKCKTTGIGQQWQPKLNNYCKEFRNSLRER